MYLFHIDFTCIILLRIRLPWWFGWKIHLQYVFSSNEITLLSRRPTKKVLHSNFWDLWFHLEMRLWVLNLFFYICQFKNNMKPVKYLLIKRGQWILVQCHLKGEEKTSRNFFANNNLITKCFRSYIYLNFFFISTWRMDPGYFS